MPSLNVPLFHGTSTALLPAILRRGLGAADPVAALDAIACLRALTLLADDLLANDDWWAVEADCTCRMVDQSISAGGFNFRHGQTYVSASELTAVRYALSNCVGSELLSACIELRERMNGNRTPDLAAIELKYKSIFLLRETHAQPVLIRLDGVSPERLLSETGESPSEVLASINFLVSEGLHEALEGHNFLLAAPVDAKGLLVFGITVEEEDRSFPKYSLTPYAKSAT